jgi:apolipoprotein N-acyltransferase
MLLAHLGYGVVRLPAGPVAIVPDIRLRIVQPAIPQAEKWQADNAERIFQQFLRLSEAISTDPSVAPPNVLVWPESAFPFLLAQHPEALAAIGALLPPGAILVTGAARAEAASGNAPGKVFNSVYVIDDRGQFLDVYDKVHLVPFGEYLPFQETLEAAGIQQLTALPGGFSAGQERRTLSISPVPPFGPLVCYEIICPSEVVEAGNRPRWLLNVTNDAWYGNTPGPYQHFEQARVRAVEEGLPLVRAANTGISAIVDGYGRIIGELGLEREGVVDGPLPTSLSVTPYGRYGDLIFLIMLVVACVVATVTKLARNVIDN